MIYNLTKEQKHLALVIYISFDPKQDGQRPQVEPQ